MSLTYQEKPTTSDYPRSYAGAREYLRPETPVKPEIGVRVRVSEKPKTKSRSSLAWMAGITVACFGASVMVTSLWGNVELERARYQERDAIERATEAKRVEASLRARVEGLTSGATVLAWADTNGFEVYRDVTTSKATD